MDLKEGFVLFIETNEYAGNFEREMCAHITGHVGDCEVGEEFVSEEIQTLFEPYIKYARDHNGTQRPCECDSNSVIIYLSSKPTEELIQIIKERANTFNEMRKITGRMAEFYKDSKIEILGFKLLEIKHTTEEIEINL